ncbi:prephenate dehydrogenase [Terriglobus roseus DSM 18391]|uniref:Prephenate dehydrogenase n=1 Tax=Terriglobus roseus (strain DSM 18391 / NRRL B-41598 / KBS 63) TaxID=926566 RepID=I3ZCL6_TERRK|nr:prephenate dehydrogenase [Terriglobus roseus]AFL86984.1 prephenate dehydrogenase [Terriglobus roseus DSM 18391]
MKNVTIVGTGLIGASIGLALREAGFAGGITGIDASGDELKAALMMSAIDTAARSPDEHRAALEAADVIVLAVPVLGILNWMRQMAPHMGAHQLVTDVGSTKTRIAELAQELMPGRCLPGHPMAGKESGGAALAEAKLFRGATWIFTPLHASTEIEMSWRGWVERFGAHILDLPPERHDRICAWVSHMPQMVSTAMSAMLEDEFGDSPELRAIGGRALREMTRLGASPYSMWRDIAHTNEAPLAETLHTLEQRLQHMRENLKTAELREEFARANEFRRRIDPLR